MSDNAISGTMAALQSAVSQALQRGDTHAAITFCTEALQREELTADDRAELLKGRAACYEQIGDVATALIDLRAAGDLLAQQVEMSRREASEALEHQAATSEVLRALSSFQPDLRSLLEIIAVNAAKVCGADDAHIYRIEHDKLIEWTHRGPIPGLEAGESLPLNRGSVIGRAIVDRQTIHMHDAAVDLDETEYPVSFQLQRRWGYRTALSTPLLRDGEPIGGIAIRRKVVQPFTERQIDLLKTFAHQAVIAMQIAAVKGRMERELQSAFQVQASLIPHELPQLARWEIAGRWRPARELSGDYYDVIRESDGRLGLVIGDVADKGMPSALFMVFVRSAVRTAVDQGHTPAETIVQTNRLVAQESTNGLFVTLIYARLEPVTGWLAYVNAGHNPALHYRAATGELTELVGTGIPLGILAEVPYAERQAQLGPGDVVVFYTDGVTEAMNTVNEEFGMVRLREAVLTSANRSAEEVAAAIEAAVQDFARSTSPFDDLTLMVVRRLPGD
jgi:GAF domain-containing protein